MSAAGRFAPGAGRPRPPHRPRTVGCPSCGDTVSLQDERAELVVCRSCGSHLELTEDELKIIGAGAERAWRFDLDLGDSFRHRGLRYEVVARMAYVEEPDDPPTRQYLLYHPAHGSMWLSEYQGNWDLSEPTHVMPKRGPFALLKGDDLQTHDGGRWVAVESGVTRLAYVDGALPWMAKVGDVTHYAELVAADGSGELYEVEASGDEVEHGRGRRLPVEAVRAATGRRDLPDPVVPSEDIVGRRRMFRRMLAIAAAALVLNLLMLLWAGARGHEVLTEQVDAAALSGEVITAPFEISKAGEAVRIELRSPRLDNAWMAVDVAVVRGEDAVIHVDDADISYYHGVDGGETWSEGSRSEVLYLRVPEPGPHRLLLHAVSAEGETPTADGARHDLQVRVTAGAARPLFPGLVAGLSAVCLIALGAGYQKWRSGGDDDEEDD